MALSSSRPVAPPLRQTGVVTPDRLYVLTPGLSTERCHRMAIEAANIAQRLAPKLSGAGARSIEPYWGTGYYGVKWARPYMWAQEAGTKPFTMRSLAGKTIPMWIDDPTGTEARKNPNAKTRITESGKRQVLIFRRAAKIGARKTVVRRDRNGALTQRSVPASYPGAPGRIAQREVTDSGPTGKIAKRSSQPNIGVRWRNPGILGRGFMHEALRQTGHNHGLNVVRIDATYGRA